MKKIYGAELAENDFQKSEPADYKKTLARNLVSIQKGCIITSFLHHFFWYAVCTWSFIEALQLLYVYHFSIFEESEAKNYLILLAGWSIPATLNVGRYLCNIMTSQDDSLSLTQCSLEGDVKCGIFLNFLPISKSF